MGAAIAGGILAFGSIFLFKRRGLQIGLSYLSIIPALAIFGLAHYFTKEAPISTHYLTGMFIPVVSGLLSLGAILFIKKDEKLVRSMDRLR